MPNKRSGLGSEHPLCDSVQLAMVILYFSVWGVDSLGHFVFGISTIMTELTSSPLLLIPAILSLSFGIYLVLRSHEAVFGEIAGQSELIDSGVYSWMRHPMYLGTLLFCLGFFFAVPSLLSLGVWIAFSVFYDKMATYEEEDLIRVLGDEYIKYKEHVPKWIPRLGRRKSK